MATSEPSLSADPIRSSPSCAPSSGCSHEYATEMRWPPAAVVAVTLAGNSTSGSQGITGTRSYPPRCQPNWAEASVNNRRAAPRVFDYDITVPLLDRYEASSSPPRYSAPASGADAATLGPLGMKPK